MRKLLFSGIALILAILVIVPLVMGQIVKHEFKRALNQQSLSHNIHLSLVKYDTGWFSSQATLQIRTPLPWFASALTSKKTLPQQITYTTTLRIYHGPISIIRRFNGHRRWYWGHGIASGLLMPLKPQPAFFNKLQSPEKPLHLFVKFDMNGSIALQLYRDDFKFIDLSRQFMLETGPIQWHLHWKKDDQKIASTLTIHHIDLLNKRLSVKLKRLDYHITLRHLQAKKIPLGNGWLKIPVMTISLGNQPFAKLKGLFLSAHSSIDRRQQTVNKKTHILIKKIAIKHVETGPLNINVNAKTRLKPLQALLALIHRRAYTSLPPKTQHKKIRHYVINILKHTRATFAATLGGEKDIVLKGEIHPSQTATSMPALIHGLLMRATFSMPANRLSNTRSPDQFDMLLSTFSTIAYNNKNLVKQDGRLIAHLIYQAGRLKINGHYYPKIEHSRQTENRLVS
jgi:uncharacterized protein YdgA (DUF945 family)